MEETLVIGIVWNKEVARTTFSWVVTHQIIKELQYLLFVAVQHSNLIMVRTNKAQEP